MKNWEQALVIQKEDNIPDNVLESLLDGGIPVVVLRGWLSSALLKAVVSELYAKKNHYTQSVYNNATLTTYGTYLAKNLHSLPRYFEEYQRMISHIPPSALALNQTVYDIVKKVLKLESLSTATEEKYGNYSPSVLRIHADGVANPLHNDLIMRDAKELDILLTKLTAQLSCVTCIQECESGGELIMYSKSWQPSDERYKVDGLGYHANVVKYAQELMYKPIAGDIYLLNPTYYHEIVEVKGSDRITQGFFFGFIRGNYQSAVAWS